MSASAAVDGDLERLLLRELSHRMSNELTVAIAAVALAVNACSNEESKVALRAMQSRLESQARVHNALRVPECITVIEAAPYINHLCRAISASKLEGRGIDLSLSLDSISMRSERCWLLGMIVSEVLTNASRHAFSERGGSIRLELVCVGSKVECRITDTGTSGDDPVLGTGLGIVQSLAAALRGEIEMRFGVQGSETILHFPHTL